MQHKNRWLIITGLTIAAIAFAGVLILPGMTRAQGLPWGNGQTSCSHYGSGWQGGMMGRVMGMFGGSACGGSCSGDMIGGFSMLGGPGMMGGGQGMMDGFTNSATGPHLTLDEAHAIAERYVAHYIADTALEVKEVMEFSQNFYAEVVETETGIGAFELLINPVSGYVHPEPGPNMMWNTKYGMHGGSGGMMGGMMGGNRDFNRSSPETTLTPEQAITQAQSYLDQSMPGLTVGDEVDRFYGYYTLHTLKDGEVEGMLSVNGSSGEVWYHSWHGDFIGMTAEAHD